MSMINSLDRPPMEEIAKRAAEAGGGAAAAAKGLALMRMKSNQEAATRREQDSHVIGMQTLGMKKDDMVDSGEDTVGGNVIITGDINGDEAIRMMREMQNPSPLQPETQPETTIPIAEQVETKPEPTISNPVVATLVPGIKTPNLIAKLLPLALTGVTALGIGWAISNYMNPPVTDDNTEYFLELVTD